MVEPSTELQAVFDKAVSDAKKLNHEYVTLEHLTHAMLCEENFQQHIEDFGADSKLLKHNLENYLKTKLVYLTEHLHRFCFKDETRLKFLMCF